MNNNDFYHNAKPKSDPASRNYAKVTKNKANENSPFGKDEPSDKTTFK